MAASISTSVCPAASASLFRQQRRCQQRQAGRQWQRRRRQQSSGFGPITCQAQPTVTLYDCYDQQIPYEEAWRWQKQLVEARASAASSSSSNSSRGSNTGTDSRGSSSLGSLLLLQHQPVYTMGTGSTEGHLKFDPAAPPLPLYRTERGGEVTYHGPGQLVMYPILSLRQPPLQPDLHWYLRSLEEVVVRALDAVSGLHGERIPGLTGVWVDGQKVAALGVRASRWVTYHGLALNVATDLTPFQQIVPCGISGRAVASVQGLLAAQQQQQQRGQQQRELEGWEDPLAAGFQAGPAAPTVMTAAVVDQQQQQQQQQQGHQVPTEVQLLEEYRHGLLDAFQEVFQVQLEAAEAAGGAQLLAGWPPSAMAAM